MKSSILRLSEAFENMCGPLRNMEEFAKDCGKGKNTIYRYARGEFKRVPSDSVIQTLIDNKYEFCEITFEELKALMQEVVDSAPITITNYSRSETVKILRESEHSEMLFLKLLPTLIEEPYELKTKEYCENGFCWDCAAEVGDSEVWLYETIYVKTDSEVDHLLSSNKIMNLFGRILISQKLIGKKVKLTIVLLSSDYGLRDYVSKWCENNHYDLPFSFSVMVINTKTKKVSEYGLD